MNREDIQQHVFNAIGMILVDKSEIHENSSFEDLKLDDADVHSLFDQLEAHYRFEFPDAVKTRAVKKPEELILAMVVDLILMLRKDQPQRPQRKARHRYKK